MKIHENDIVILDLIIDKILELGYFIEVDNLFKSGEITEPDYKKRELEFQRLLTIIEELKCATVNHSDQGWRVEPNRNTLTFQKNGGFKTYSQEELNRLEKEREIEILTTNKLRWDSKLSKWQVKTFWWIFVFGFFGFIFGLYNFIDNLNKTKSIEELELSNQETQEEVSRLRTLVLDQKTVYSLHNSRTQIDSLRPR